MRGGDGRGGIPHPPENATTIHGVGIQADSRGGGAGRIMQDTTTPRNFT